ncbi:MAG TPA: hypothetical protein VHC86_01760 [Opitutaceae bacterium]|nr:hypothetical protein [Opitutaceae bacterium]
MSRLSRHREHLRRLFAAGAAALVLALAILAASPTLHAWLHGEKTPDADDGCAVVLFVHGITPALGAVLLAAAALRRLPERAAVFSAPLWAAPAHQLPPGRGPPAR